MMRSAVGGGVAAAVWGLQEEVDKKVFNSNFSDVAFLGKLLTHSLGISHQVDWWKVGMAAHIVNGAVIGSLIPLVANKLKITNFTAAFVVIGVEHISTYPLTYFTDKYHPAIKEGDVGPVFGSINAFSQATYRHLLFGLISALISSGRSI